MPPASAERPPRKLRTVLCTRGGLFGAVVLEALHASPAIELCGIVRSARWFSAGRGPLAGSVAYLQRCGLRYSVYLLCATTVADALCGRGRRAAVPHRSRPGAPPVHTTRDINVPAALEFLRRCAPELLVSAYFDQRLGEPALGVPRLACLNIHPALLPSFRGVDPVLQARLRGAPTGVTVHHMTGELDAGAIVAQRAVSTDEDSSIFRSTAQLFRAGADLLLGALDSIAPGGGTPQTASGSYQSWPSHDEVRALRARGGRLIRFSDLRC